MSIMLPQMRSLWFAVALAELLLSPLALLLATLRRSERQ